MGRKNIPASRFVSPSSSQIVADNFSGQSSNQRDPKSEIIWFDLSTSANDCIRNNYELCPLPDLLSLEHPVPDPYRPFSISTGDLVPVVKSSPNKRFRPLLPPSNPNPNPFGVPNLRPRGLPSNEIARRRRNKIGERIKVLEDLMPWSTKMPMAKLLEEAHTYIKFLEAQVTALQTMPIQSAMFGSVGFDPSGRFGGLEMLNRQQMLQVMVNSSIVQSLLYRKGCCVFSEEQEAELRRLVVEGRSPTMMLLPGSCSSAPL